MLNYSIIGISTKDGETYTQITFKAPKMDEKGLKQYTIEKFKTKTIRWRLI